MGKLLYRVTVFFENKQSKVYLDVENVYVSGQGMTIVQRPNGEGRVIVETVTGVKSHRAEAQE